MEPFLEKGSRKSKENLVFYSSANNLFKKSLTKNRVNYGGIISMVEFRPVEPGTGVRFSYTALNPFGKSVNGKEEVLEL